MNKVFEDFRRGLGFIQPSWSEPISEFNAKIDVKETDKEIVVTAEIPGVDMKDINVSIKEDTLQLTGEKKQEKEEKHKGYYRMERSYGSFYRVIPLPAQVDRSAVHASYKHGVVTVVLPKTGEALASEQKIQVKAG